MAYQAKVLTISDSVMKGEREDLSGPAVVQALSEAGFEVVESLVVADGVASVAGELTRLASGFCGIVASVGGTGFGPRDLTPEGTHEVIEREAPGFAEMMRHSSPLGALSRGVAGLRGRALILNLPGSPTGAVESFKAVAGILPHALDLLSGAGENHPKH